MRLRGRENLPVGSSISFWAGAPTILAEIASRSTIATVGLHTRSGEQSPGPADRIRSERFLPQSACFLPRASGGTCVAVGRRARGDVGHEWGMHWFNWGFARFRLESPRCFWGSSLNQQERRQGRQPQDCPVRVFRLSGQSTLSFSGSACRWDQGPPWAIAYDWQAWNRRSVSMPQPTGGAC